MSVFLGVTQDLNGAKIDLLDHFEALDNWTEIGPFHSGDDAQDWIDFMLEEHDDYEVVTLEETYSIKKPFYGFTFGVA